ncbi:hypothetical protein L2Y97_03045 [Luteibacter aegosomatissinici]|nr:hypothetical protein [Luteibacter aegosomatissinici]UPG96651.1 hypothetical protein L2Y97_03045 [Luteibacter aegosomatissinici]
MKKYLLTTGVLAALITTGSLSIASAAEQSFDIAAAAQAQAVSSWNETIRQQAPNVEGCFHASFPSAGWQAERCEAPPSFVSVPPVTNGNGLTTTARSESIFTVGNGNDYAARTGSLTKSAVGTFPTVTGVTTGTADYSLQINTNIGSNPTTCSQFGYSSCQTWEQFIYSTDSDGNSANGRTPVAFIQDWFFAGSQSQYNSVGCPSGWYSYPAQYACYRNSNAVSVPLVAVSNIGTIQLTGSATSGGVDTVTFSVSGSAHSVSQTATTLNINRIWNQSEFNIFGNGSDNPVVSFNKGSHVTVNLAVNDGSTSAPTCLGSAGTTYEQNNLTLGSCTATGGSSPHISFVESN